MNESKTFVARRKERQKGWGWESRVIERTSNAARLEQGLRDRKK